ncbi:MAG: porin family protein [Tardiphaga sp.]|jgi:opacity protein-like surface antigen|nr:porin family protein [Tardiphaga sp.]
MITNKSILAVGAVALMSSATFAGHAVAADMASRMPQQYYAPPPPQEDFGGWYLRGDIGQTNSKGKLHSNVYDTLPANSNLAQLGQGFSGGTSYGLGVGYQFNSWFRADITGEYRSKVNFSGSDFVTFNPGGSLSDTYTGGYSSWVGLVNAYVDLGTWWCITPFIGAGVGAANITTTGITDNGLANGNAGSYFADGASKTNLAWAAHAGLAYKVNNNFTVELAYRYLDMGTAAHGYGRSYDGTNAGPSSFQYRDITSQDVKIGVRWTCCDLPEPPPPPPLVRKG